MNYDEYQKGNHLGSEFNLSAIASVGYRSYIESKLQHLKTVIERDGGTFILTKTGYFIVRYEAYIKVNSEDISLYAQEIINEIQMNCNI